MSEIEDSVRNIVWDQTGDPSDVQLDSTLEDLGFDDDIDRVALAMELESSFSIEIPDEDLAAWVTVQDVVQSVSELL